MLVFSENIIIFARKYTFETTILKQLKNQITWQQK